MIVRAARAALAIAALSACDAREPATPAGSATAQQSRAVGSSVVASATVLPASFGIGRAARPGEVRAWDIDVSAAGVGLPNGRGTYQQGARLYALKCASCHGANGEGIAPNPRLIGAEPRDFSFARDAKIPKTIGNYWPHATTLFDYINRAMPFDSPGTLTAGEVYALVAYLLAENGVTDRSTEMDARALLQVRMPARGRFVRDTTSLY